MGGEGRGGGGGKEKSSAVLPGLDIVFQTVFLYENFYLFFSSTRVPLFPLKKIFFSQ